MFMRSTIWRKALLATAMLTLLAGFSLNHTARAEGESAPAKADPPKALWSQTTYEFAPLMEGTDIQHDFIVENKGQGPLTISKVQPD
jgi:hypothetical protein